MEKISQEEAQQMSLDGKHVYIESSSNWGVNAIRWDSNSNMLQVGNVVGEFGDFSKNALTSLLLRTPTFYKLTTASE